MAELEVQLLSGGSMEDIAPVSYWIRDELPIGIKTLLLLPDSDRQLLALALASCLAQRSRAPLVALALLCARVAHGEGSVLGRALRQRPGGEGPRQRRGRPRLCYPAGHLLATITL